MAFSRPCALALDVIAAFMFYAVDGGIYIPSTLDGPFEPVTVPFDANLRGNAVDLPDSDPRVQRLVNGFEPEQISVSLSANYDSVWISWITGPPPLPSNWELLQFLFTANLDQAFEIFCFSFLFESFLFLLVWCVIRSP